MRQSTAIATTIIRLLAIGFIVWAVLCFAFWITHPLAVRIQTLGPEATGLDLTDFRGLIHLVALVAFAAALYGASLSVACAATPNHDVAPAFSVAFTSIRLLAFVLFAFALLLLAFDFLEVPIAY